LVFERFGEGVGFVVVDVGYADVGGWSCAATSAGEGSDVELVLPEKGGDYEFANLACRAYDGNVLDGIAGHGCGSGRSGLERARGLPV